MLICKWTFSVPHTLLIQVFDSLMILMAGSPLSIIKKVGSKYAPIIIIKSQIFRSFSIKSKGFSKCLNLWALKAAAVLPVLKMVEANLFAICVLIVASSKKSIRRHIPKLSSFFFAKVLLSMNTKTQGNLGKSANCLTQINKKNCWKLPKYPNKIFAKSHPNLNFFPPINGYSL